MEENRNMDTLELMEKMIMYWCAEDAFHTWCKDRKDCNHRIQSTEHEVGDVIAGFATATELFRSGSISRDGDGILWWPFYDGERDRNSCHHYCLIILCFNSNFKLEQVETEVKILLLQDFNYNSSLLLSLFLFVAWSLFASYKKYIK